MKHVYTLFVISVCVLFSTTVWGENDFLQPKDSLLKVIELGQGKEKLNAYAELTTKVLYSEEQSDTLFLYFRRAIREAQKQGNKLQEAQFKTNYITYLYNYERRKELMETAPDFLKFLAENDDREQYYTMAGLLLETYLNECWFETAIKEAKLLYDKASQQNHPTGMSVATYIIGAVYQKLERYGDAEEYFKKTVAILKRTGTEPPLLFDTYFVLSEVLSEQKRYSEALKITKELGNLVERREKMDNHSYPVSRYSYNLIQAMVYLEMGEFEKADSFLDVAAKQLPEIERAMVNIYYHRARIAELRKNYQFALQLCDEAYRLCEIIEEYPFSGDVMKIKCSVLSKMRGNEDLLDLFEQYTAIRDSIEQQEFHARIDEFRTQYEVDMHIAEKERNLHNFLFALGGCILLLIILGGYIYYSRQITKKNRTLVKQMFQLQQEQEQKETELLAKTTFETATVLQSESDAVNLCPESRKDKICLALRDLMLKEKVYRDETLSRTSLTTRLGINRYALEDAFMFCFGTPFSEYINLLRLNDSIVMLQESDLSMEEISEKVGYGTLRTFQRQFKEKYDMSPKEYRRLAQEKKE